MSIVVVFTYEQLRALKAVLGVEERVDWKAYDEAKDVLLTAPLDVPEDNLTIGQIHVVPA